MIIGPGRPYPESDVTDAMADIAPAAGMIPWDPVSAAVLSDGTPPRRGFDRGPLMRSMKHLTTVLTDGKDPDVEARGLHPENAQPAEISDEQADSERDLPTTTDDARVSASAGSGSR